MVVPRTAKKWATGSALRGRAGMADRSRVRMGARLRLRWQWCAESWIWDGASGSGRSRSAGAWQCRTRLGRGPQLRVTPKRTPPYRPQTNGNVERFHRILADGWAYARLYESTTEPTPPSEASHQSHDW